MARMSIDDMVVRDPRITKLGSILGWSRREVVGCLVLDVWPICYDQRESIIAADLIDIASGRVGFAAAMVDCQLATWARGNSKVRISGAQERIEYLDRKRRAGVVGGLNSAQSRAKNSSTPPPVLKHDSGSAQALANPSVPSPSPSPSPVPDSASAPVPDSEKNSAAPPACGSTLDLFKAKVDSAVGDVGARRARKPKPSEPTADERAAALRVLSKLSERNGVRYSGTDEHIRLITNRLRDGIEEMHLRYVIAYCAAELDWTNKPEMANYLRPETLFGPKTIAKYLDPALTWVSKLPDDNQPQSQAGAS